MEKTSVLRTKTDKKVFYDWMGMHENGTFKEGATGYNYLAFHTIYHDITDELYNNVKRLWNDMQENALESTSDEWLDATQYVKEEIDKHCKADDDEKEAILWALRYNIDDYDFNEWLDDRHKVEVHWWTDEIEVEIREKTNTDIFEDWAHVDHGWYVKDGFSDENYNAFCVVVNKFVDVIEDRIHNMSQYDTRMEWVDCDKWLEDTISRECRANERECEAIFEVAMDYITTQCAFVNGWIEREDDKTIIHRVNEEEKFNI